MKCAQGCGLHVVAYWLLIVGGLNWGLVGAFDLNVLDLLFGSSEWDWLLTIVYILVGLSAVLALFKDSCKACKK